MLLKTAVKYPFLNGATEVVAELKINIWELEGENSHILDEAVERLKSAIVHGEIIVEFTDLESELLSYPTAFLLASYIKDNYLLRRWALAESIRAQKYLLKEDPSVVVELAQTEFNWNIKYIGEEVREFVFAEKPYIKIYEYSLFFPDFLRYSERFHENSWKLVNREMINGYVLISRAEMVRLLREEIYYLMWAKDVQDRALDLPTFIQVAAEELRQFLAENKPEYEALKTNMDALPPCISYLLDGINRGRNLSQYDRFVLVTFLNWIDVGIEEMVDIFGILLVFN
jgi:DNA primase large subunit